MFNIMIVEDEKDICEILEIYLTSEGYDTVIASNGEEALVKLKRKHVDLVITDIMMPAMDGFRLIKAIRETYDTPILVLSAKDNDYDKILGLNIGADDYITKPFNPMEIVARVNAHLRRNKIVQERVGSNELKFDKIILNLECLRVFIDHQEIALTATEFKILTLFMKSPGQVFSKSQVSQYVNPDYFASSDHAIVVHIANLRDKMDVNSDNSQYIKTVKGLGYKLE